MALHGDVKHLANFGAVVRVVSAFTPPAGTAAPPAKAPGLAARMVRRRRGKQEPKNHATIGLFELLPSSTPDSLQLRLTVQPSGNDRGWAIEMQLGRQAADLARSIVPVRGKASKPYILLTLAQPGEAVHGPEYDQALRTATTRLLQSPGVDVIGHGAATLEPRVTDLLATVPPRMPPKADTAHRTLHTKAATGGPLGPRRGG